MKRHIDVTVVVVPDGDGYYARCPALPSIFIHGETVQDALDQVPDALVLALDFMDENNQPYPVGEDFSIEEEQEVYDSPTALQPHPEWSAKLSANLSVSV